MPNSTSSMLTVHLAQETDFLLARQRAKQIAALAGFDPQDQTRIATAVSEIARNAFEYATEGRVEYFLDPASDLDLAAPSRLRIVVSDRGKGIPHLNEIWLGTYKSHTGMGLGILGARRLLDSLEIQSETTGTTATLVRRLPPNRPAPSIEAIVRSLAASAVSSGNALRDQNQELLRLLNELRIRESELEQLNQELAETNRGVLVLYTELEDKAEAVQQASEMKTRFLSGVTHELRTPLNSIVSLARLLIARVDGDLNPEQEKQVQFILRSAQNLTEMVNDLLDLARLEAGKTDLKLAEFTVQDLFAGLRGMFRPLVASDRVTLTFVPPAQPLRLHSDEGKLAQILRNFISNALKFTERGSVTVTAAQDSMNRDAIVFSVADTGVGIAPEHAELVMQEWGQVEATTHNKQKGSGLGLPLARSLAQLLGGTIDFISVPGEGSTFRVTIPGLLQPGNPLPPPEPIPAPSRILMAAREDVERYLLRRWIAAHTTAVLEEAITGEDVLEAVQLRRPSILFLDLLLPGLSGTDVIERLRENPETRELPIVVHTAKVLTPAEQETLKSLDIEVIPVRRPSSGRQADREEQDAQFERALLQVGLSNLNQRRPGA